MKKPFKKHSKRKIGTLRLPNTTFNLNHRVTTTFDAGQIIPVCFMECIPSDVFDISVAMLLRCLPMVFPPFTGMRARVDFFFVPHRLTWPEVITPGTPPTVTDGFPVYLNGGADGTTAPTHPTWSPTDTTSDSLWCYFGHPVGIVPTGFLPTDLWKRAYNMIWNTKIRNPEIQDLLTIETAEDVQYVNWMPDRFTTAKFNTQLGTAPALPVTLSGTLNIDASGADGGTYSGANSIGVDTGADLLAADGGANADMLAALNKQVVDISGGSATSISLNDFREAQAIQRYLERNLRTGSRYRDLLKGVYNANPRDSRLAEPEYLGSAKIPIIVSEVVQTSETNTTPQGNLAGHGIATKSQKICRYRVDEFGVILGLLHVDVETSYEQGVNRQAVKKTRYDYPNPFLANIGMAEVFRGELYANAVDADNNTVFGYQDMYDEYREIPSINTGLIRTTMDYSTQSRQFGGAPSLNDTFLKQIPRKDCMADSDDPQFMVTVGNIVSCNRILPAVGYPI